MSDTGPAAPNRWKRFSDWDERPLRLDNFAIEDPANGFAAMAGAKDPKPGVKLSKASASSSSTVSRKPIST